MKIPTSVLTFLLMTASCLAGTTPQGRLAQAIAKAEGYGVRGTIPTRCNNPGDLKVVRGWLYPGQVGVCKGGHVRFKTAAEGWAALNHQLDKIVEGTSRYTVNSTLASMARRYAGNYRVWAKNVAHNLGVTPDAELWEILDVAPRLQ
jgi:hypothetical protein